MHIYLKYFDIYYRKRYNKGVIIINERVNYLMKSTTNTDHEIVVATPVHTTTHQSNHNGAKVVIASLLICTAMALSVMVLPYVSCDITSMILANWGNAVFTALSQGAMLYYLKKYLHEDMKLDKNTANMICSAVSMVLGITSLILSACSGAAAERHKEAASYHADKATPYYSSLPKPEAERILHKNLATDHQRLGDNYTATSTFTSLNAAIMLGKSISLFCFGCDSNTEKQQYGST